MSEQHEHEEAAPASTNEEATSKDERSAEEREAQEGAEPSEAVALEASENESQEMEEGTLVPALEALFFASGESLSSGRLAEITGADKKAIEHALAELEAAYADGERGVELICVGGKYLLRTKARYAPILQKYKAGRPRKLSPAALETLAIIAYRQPIVKSDVEKLRGVDATPTIKTLLERKIIKIVGHQATPGQPALYGTTEEFLKLFGLSSLSELPTLQDLKELEEDPGEEGEQETFANERAEEEAEALGLNDKVAPDEDSDGAIHQEAVAEELPVEEALNS